LLVGGRKLQRAIRIHLRRRRRSCIGLEGA